MWDDKKSQHSSDADADADADPDPDSNPDADADADSDSDADPDSDSDSDSDAADFDNRVSQPRSDYISRNHSQHQWNRERFRRWECGPG
jgi:hypothetical protein